MDSRFLSYYSQELTHLREMTGEFAVEFPKIAGRLGLGSFDCADPYVERLLEGFAYMAARVQLKLDDGFPRLTESILQTVFPMAAAPIPSMMITQMHPNFGEAGLAGGVTIPRQTNLKANLTEGMRTACQYRTAHDVMLWPVELTAANYLIRDLNLSGVLEAQTAAAGLKIHLQCKGDVSWSKLAMDSLPIFLRGEDEIVLGLLEQIFSSTQAVVLRDPQGSEPPVVLPADSIRPVGLDNEQALLPNVAQRFRGYRLLQEYFAFPPRFQFFELTQLQRATRDIQSQSLEITLLFDLARPELLHGIDASRLLLYCTPAINLHRKRTDRIGWDERQHEFHVIPDRTRPRDYEVYSVEQLTAYDESNNELFTIHPFYAPGGDSPLAGNSRGSYFSVHRRPRLESSGSRKSRRSTYDGSEMFVSFSGPNFQQFEEELYQIGVETLSTNRDLPLLMPLGVGQTDFHLSESLPVTAVRCVVGPTRPRPAPAAGDKIWQAISHLRLNYLSLSDTQQGSAAEAMQEMLLLYAQNCDEFARQQVTGLVGVETVPITRRMPGRGPICFARGLEVKLAFDERAFVGMGCFLLGTVLSEFLAHYVTINSFTESVVTTMQRGEIKRWPAKLGVNSVIG